MYTEEEMERIIRMSRRIICTVSASLAAIWIFAGCNTSGVITGSSYNKISDVSNSNVYEAHQESYESLYRRILEGIEEVKDSLDISAYNVQPRRIYRIVDDILDNHPQIFYLNRSNLKFSSGGTLELSYLYNKADIVSMKSKLDKVLSDFEAEINSQNLDILQKVIFVHHYLIKKADYGIDSGMPQMSHNVYGVLVNGRGVYNGYAKSAKLLFDKIGIKSTIIYGEANGIYHAWNKLEIGDKTYNLDVTWDDLESTDNKMSYRYFNKSDEEFSVDHVPYR